MGITSLNYIWVNTSSKSNVQKSSDFSRKLQRPCFVPQTVLPIEMQPLRFAQSLKHRQKEMNWKSPTKQTIRSRASSKYWMKVKSKLTRGIRMNFYPGKQNPSFPNNFIYRTIKREVVLIMSCLDLIHPRSKLNPTNSIPKQATRLGKYLKLTTNQTETQKPKSTPHPETP